VDDEGGTSGRSGGPLRGIFATIREDIGITVSALSTPGQLRRLLVAEGQSALGDALADVALLLIAYQRLHSPWALSAVLLADRVPRVVLAPLAGVLADKVSRRTCLIVADFLRAGALLALVLVSSFPLTVVFAGVLGCGTALYRPVVEASLPSIAGGRDGAARAVTSRWTIIVLGELLGWTLAGAMLLAFAPTSVLLFDAATFAISISILSGITHLDRLDEAAEEARAGMRGSLRMLSEGARATRRIPGILVLFVTVLSAILAGGLMNVGDPLLAKNVLHSGNAGFGALKAAVEYKPELVFLDIGLPGLTGHEVVERMRRELGMTDTYIVRSVASMRDSYFRALGIAAVGVAIMAAAPSLAIAMIGSVILGAGNGLAVARHLQLIQLTVPESLIGRINGLLNAAEAGAFVFAFVFAGAAVVLLGVRNTFALSAVALLLAAVVGFIRMHRLRDQPELVADGDGREPGIGQIDRIPV